MAAVGSIKAMNNIKSVFGQITGTVTRANPLGGATDDSFAIDDKSLTKWIFGVSALDTINQEFNFIFTAPKNSTTTLNLSVVTVANNRVGDANATLSVIRKITFEYLTNVQDAVNGTAATGKVTIQPSAVHPIITSPLGVAGSYAMLPGHKWDAELHDAAGITVAVGANDQLDFVNADLAVDAHFKIKIFGNK